jgi:RNA polymerase sigma factor (sigma-70 family)
MSPWISVHFLQTQSDERLLAAAREGHERAFEALVQRYRRRLLRYCRCLLLPESTADDAVQQGLLQAWLALQRGTEVRDAKAWLFRVVHNAAIDALRSSGYDHEQLSESLQGATAPHWDLERRIAVRQALAGLSALPEMQRDALLRTAIAGHSHEEVAAALGLSDGAVRGLIYRARTTLRATATAITPTPLLAWVADAGRRSAPLAERLGGAGTGGASADAGGALLKSGVAVLTAGALVAGSAAVHPLRASRAHHRGPPTTAYQGTRAGGAGRSPLANASSTIASRSGGAGRADAAGRSASFDRAEGSARERRLAPSVAPAGNPADQGRPAIPGGVPGGKPQTVAAHTPSGGIVPETPAGSPIGSGPDSYGSRGVRDGPGASGFPLGGGSSEPRDSSGSNDGSDAGLGFATAARAEGGGTHASSDEVSSGSTGAAGPTGYGSSEQDVARAASTGPSGNTDATPQGDE